MIKEAGVMKHDSLFTQEKCLESTVPGWCKRCTDFMKRLDHGCYRSGSKEGTVIIYSIKPEDSGPWLACLTVGELEETLLQSEPDDTWIIKLKQMTIEEAKNLKEHEGW